MMQISSFPGVVFRVFVLITAIALFGCKTQNVPGKTAASYKPLSHKILVDKPFGFEPSIQNFSKHFIPPYKLKRYAVLNKHKTNETDTIYRFFYKKSELFVYKTKLGKEMFFAGNISDSKIVLLNGIRVGIPRKTFFGYFTDLKFSTQDTIKITSTARMTNYKFVFKKDKLEAIKIDAYID